LQSEFRFDILWAEIRTIAIGGNTPQTRKEKQIMAEKHENRTTNYMGLGICLGVALGIMLDSIPVGFGLGIAVGAALNRANNHQVFRWSKAEAAQDDSLSSF
jgi:hypothetical protein